MSFGWDVGVLEVNQGYPSRPTCCWALSMKFVWHVGEVELLEVVVNTAVVLPSDELRLLLPVWSPFVKLPWAERHCSTVFTTSLIRAVRELLVRVPKC